MLCFDKSQRKKRMRTRKTTTQMTMTTMTMKKKMMDTPPALVLLGEGSRYREPNGRFQAAAVSAL